MREGDGKMGGGLERWLYRREGDWKGCEGGAEREREMERPDDLPKTGCYA